MTEKTTPDAGTLVGVLRLLDQSTTDAQANADAHDQMEPQDLADAVALIQDLKARLTQVETDLATALGRREGAFTGYLSDGRQFTLKRSADRKEWQHDEWKRDARRVLVEQTLTNLGVTRDAVVVDPTTGLETEQTLATIIQSALTNAQEIHGSTAPRSTALKSLGLYASDYCTSTPGGWRLNAIKPTPTTTEKDA